MNDLNKVQSSAADGLKKTKMGPLGITFLLYCLVAAGAFGIEDTISSSGPGLSIVMLCVFPIIWALPICMTVSEFTAFMPSEGGVYVWAREALGEFWGFIVGWFELIGVYLFTATYVVLAVGYTEQFIPMTRVESFMLKVLLVLIFTVVNLLGLKDVSIVSTIFSLLILAAFAAVTVVGFAHMNYNPLTPFTVPGQSVMQSMGGSICIVIWMYCGYECISNMGGEIENPKVIPKGFLIAMPLIALSYILPTIAGVGSIGQWESWSTEGAGAVGYSDVLTQYLGPIWGVVFLVIAITSNCAIFNAYIAAGSREAFVMSDDRFIPAFLTKISKKRGVPYWPIIIMAGFTLVMMNFDFNTLIIMLTPINMVIYAVLAISLPLLRKKYPVKDRGDVFYIKGGKVLIGIVTALPVFLAAFSLLVDGTEYFLLGFVSILSGFVFYVILKAIYGGRYKVDPAHNPINPRTHMAKGDLRRFGAFFFIFGVYAVIGAFFLLWYEGGTGPEYYLETYGSGLMSNFALMISVTKNAGLVSAAVGVILFFIGNKYDRPDSLADNEVQQQ